MRYLAAMLGVVALLAAAPATGTAAEPRPYPSAGGTTLAGPRLIWFENSSHRLRAQDLTGGPPRTLCRQRKVGGADLLEHLDLEASASRVAFINRGIEEFSEGGTGAIAFLTLR